MSKGNIDTSNEADFEYLDAHDESGGEKSLQLNLFDLPLSAGDASRKTVMSHLFDRIPAFRKKDEVVPSNLENSSIEINFEVSDIKLKLMQQAALIEGSDAKGNKIYRFPGSKEKMVLEVIRHLACHGGSSLENIDERDVTGEAGPASMGPFISVTFRVGQIRTILNNVYDMKYSWDDIVDALQVLKGSSMRIDVLGKNPSNWTQPLIGGGATADNDYHKVYLHPLLSYSIVHGQALSLQDTLYVTFPPDSQILFNQFYARYTQASTDPRIAPFKIKSRSFLTKSLGLDCGPEQGPDDKNRTRSKSHQRMKRIVEFLAKEGVCTYKFEDIKQGRFVIDKWLYMWPTEEYVKRRITNLLGTKRMLGRDLTEKLSNDPIQALPMASTRYPEGYDEVISDDSDPDMFE